MKYFLPILATFFFVMPHHVYAGAGSDQYGQYGAAASPTSLFVDKQVSRGTATKGGIIQYTDNFSASDPRFTAGERVYFQIKVKNTSNAKITNIQMMDKLPQFIDAVEGPGDYNSQDRTISWQYAELKSGEERIEHLIVQIKPQNQLPADKGTFCINNIASGRSGNAADDDTAQFCIEKQVSMTQSGTPKVAPKAGAEFGLLLGALQIAGLGAGVILRKYSAS